MFIIREYTVSKNDYHEITALLGSIFRGVHIKTTEDIFYVAKRILRKQTEVEEVYKGEL